MATEVSSLVRRYTEERPQLQSSDLLMTKDLLGSLPKQGKIYTERYNPPESPLASSSSSPSKNQSSKQQDLNHPPMDRLYLEETCLDLKLQGHDIYQSVCTIDKVKHALERAGRESSKRKSSSPSFSSSSTSLLLPSPSPSSGMFAAACPGCLLYVMTLKSNPRCPRCNSIVPSALVPKRPRIDLNTSSF